MIKAVVFDMDGLIVDSEPIESDSIKILLEKYGKTPIYHDNGLIHVPGTAGQTYQMLIDKYNLKVDIKTLRRNRRRIFTKLIKSKTFPTSDLSNLIYILVTHNIKIALASNRNRKHIDLILTRMGVKELFEVILGPGKKIRHKPSPDIYITTAKKLKVKTEECLVLEDSESGIVAGKEAGMKVIAVPNIYTKNQDLSKADLIVNSLKAVKWSTISKI